MLNFNCHLSLHLPSLDGAQEILDCKFAMRHVDDRATNQLRNVLSGQPSGQPSDRPSDNWSRQVCGRLSDEQSGQSYAYNV